MADFSDWTIPALKLHLEARIDATNDASIARAAHFKDMAISTAIDQERALTAALAAQERLHQAAFAASSEAVGKAEAYTDKRIDALADLKNTVVEYQRALFPRSEAEGRFTALESRLSTFSKTLEDKVFALSVTIEEKFSARAVYWDEKLEARSKTVDKTTDALGADIKGLREGRSGDVGRQAASAAYRGSTQWTVGVLVGVFLAGVQVVLHFLK